ncbi:BREX-1 system phosphatase PglZ type A, partial [Amylibacter sp.]|nr:BREX-1 system phosphatase PglZ type A [Amylibacter sp.]
MRAEYKAVDLPDVEKVEIANNEFGLKYRMLRQEPEQKFLLFHDGPEPEMKDNWLLDLQFATALFKADQAAIWLAELGLPPQFEDVVRNHMEFYRSKVRIDQLKQIISPSDTKTEVIRRMLCVCANAEGSLDTVI